MEGVHHASAEIFSAAVNYGGTLTGEHGISLLNREFLGVALKPEVIEAMRRVKGGESKRPSILTA